MGEVHDGEAVPSRVRHERAGSIAYNNTAWLAAEVDGRAPFECLRVDDRESVTPTRRHDERCVIRRARQGDRVDGHVDGRDLAKIFCEAFLLVDDDGRAVAKGHCDARMRKGEDRAGCLREPHGAQHASRVDVDDAQHGVVLVRNVGDERPIDVGRREHRRNASARNEHGGSPHEGNAGVQGGATNNSRRGQRATRGEDERQDQPPEARLRADTPKGL